MARPAGRTAAGAESVRRAARRAGSGGVRDAGAAAARDVHAGAGAGPADEATGPRLGRWARRGTRCARAEAAALVGIGGTRVSGWRVCDQAGRGRREEAIAALLRRPRTTHPRSVARRQTPREVRQSLLGIGAAADAGSVACRGRRAAEDAASRAEAWVRPRSWPAARLSRSRPGSRPGAACAP